MNEHEKAILEAAIRVVESKSKPHMSPVSYDDEGNEREDYRSIANFTVLSMMVQNYREAGGDLQVGELEFTDEEITEALTEDEEESNETSNN